MDGKLTTKVCEIDAKINKRTGRFAIIEQLLADGIDHMFGNPGTVEQGFLDALSDYPDFKYIFALQETIAVAVADGYARVTKKPTVVQLHSGVGLGNGIGMIYQAMRGHAPLVVLAGEAGLRYEAMDAQMAADLVGMAKPVTKWATRVVHPDSLLRILRRAIKIAATPPMGPVFIALPADVLDALNEEEVVPTSFPVTRVAPEPKAISQAAAMLVTASKPLIIVGDGVALADAQIELTRVAELIGAQVWGADSSEPNMSAIHPLYGGLLGHMFGEDSRRITSQADAVLIVGTYVFPEVFPALSGVFAPGTKVIHIDLNTYEIAKNFPVDLGLLGDPKLTLGKLSIKLKKIMTLQQRLAALHRTEEITKAKQQQLSAQLAVDNGIRNSVPLHLSQFAQELAQQLPPDAIIFDEATTHSEELRRYISPTTIGRYFQSRGGSLGLGIPGALGIKLARPNQTVVAFTGDGAAMYTIQALWTAVHHNINAKFVICNNRSYRILKLNLLQYWSEQDIKPHQFPDSFELHHPELQFTQIAESMGVKAVRVEKPKQIKRAIAQALAYEGPFLIDVAIGSEVPSILSGTECER
jgi:thiamine pyrophosphate-dependent acetolactate synthase large subunit-like protein